MADSEMEQRWAFLSPWCDVLTGRTTLYYPGHDGRDEEIWFMKKRRLQVVLHRNVSRSYLTIGNKTVSEADTFPNWSDQKEETFLATLQKTREALALLAAVEHVDHSAWRYLLGQCCPDDKRQEGEEEFEEKIPVRFLLVIDLEKKRGPKYEGVFDHDLVHFCSPMENASAEYVEALRKIASFDATVKPHQPGLTIDVPVRVFFKYFYDAEDKFECIRTAEQIIKDFPTQDAAPGSMQCRFVLEPMKVDSNGFGLRPELAEEVESMVLSNVWFSKLALWLDMGLGPVGFPIGGVRFRENEHLARKVFGQLIARLFDSTRRSLELANTRYYFGELSPNQEQSPLQMGTVHLECAGVVDWSFEALCSALAVNQSTKQVSMMLEMGWSQEVHSRKWWKWLAYALSSKRARAHSALESAALVFLGSMTDADIDGFIAIASSDHPEEELFGTQRGRVDKRDATLVAGSEILCPMALNNRGQPRRGTQLIPAGFDIPMVRTFSDDGQSEWVNVIIPGYGGCNVQRTNLLFNEPATPRPIVNGLTELRIRFNGYSATFEGLPRFLGAIGQGLRSLTIANGGGDIVLDTNMILSCCPKLEEFAFRDDLIHARLDFSDYHAGHQPLPSFSPNWERGVEVMADDLKDATSPLSKCLRRLRVDLSFLQHGQWGARARVEEILQVLLKVLQANQSLEYLDVIVPTESMSHLPEFRAYHLQPINRAGDHLAPDSKAAFLSAMSSIRTVKPRGKKRKRLKRSVGRKLDRSVLSNIFSFARARVLRQVYFRVESRNDEGLREETPI